jgi:hypothetical protein
MTADVTSAPSGGRISKRQARDLFRAAKLNQQQMHPAAEQHYQRHGEWSVGYLAAKAETSRAFGVFLDAGVCSGITIPAPSEEG